MPIDAAPTLNEAKSRFEMHVDGQLAYLSFVRRPGIIAFDHTIVPDTLGGRGIGSALAQRGLDYAVAQGLKVDPQCPFIQAWIDKHPAYQAHSLAHET